MAGPGRQDPAVPAHDERRRVVVVVAARALDGRRAQPEAGGRPGPQVDARGLDGAAARGVGAARRHAAEHEPVADHERALVLEPAPAGVVVEHDRRALLGRERSAGQAQDAAASAVATHASGRHAATIASARRACQALRRRAADYNPRRGRRGDMEYRQLGRTDMKVSAISFGAWAIGSTWGPVDDEESMRALHAAIDAGTNFIDTADVYGDGRSERLVGAAAARAQGRDDLRRDQGRPAAAEADAGGLQPREPRRVGRPQPEEPGAGRGRPAPAPLPAPRRLRPARGVRLSRRPGEGRQDPLLRDQRRELSTRRCAGSATPACRRSRSSSTCCG